MRTDLPPGPWKRIPGTSVVTDRDGIIIAKAIARGLKAPRRPSRKVAQAMAAAPALAEALRDLMGAEGGEAGDTPDQRRAWRRAEAALRKYDAEDAP